MKESRLPAPLAVRTVQANRVCVVITAYKSARYIERAINSAMDQQWPDLRVVVVDDGFTDATASAVKSINGNLEGKYPGADPAAR
jgi:cellulose synthase/poly-beta-1,6-N-acetylglucosamine synthase-like glycosyltransferase